MVHTCIVPIRRTPDAKRSGTGGPPGLPADRSGSPAASGAGRAMYDVIIVGARVAGAATALLLARRGLKVLCVDQATFPSDTLSNHVIQLAGVACLKRWGLLDAVIAADTPAFRKITHDTGRRILEGQPPALAEADALYAPRRTILDKILVDAARRAGAEVREDFLFEGLTEAHGRVTGIL